MNNYLLKHEYVYESFLDDLMVSNEEDADLGIKVHTR